MPDPRRLVRRITQSNLPSRVIAHLSVVSLVVTASIAGFTHSQGAGTDPSRDSGFLSLVSQVRGAALPTPSAEPLVYGQGSIPEDELALLDRSARIALPAPPLPTPVPVDPDSTPLPGPSAVGQADGGAPSSRGVAPAAPVPAPTSLVWPVPGGSISQYFHAGHLALDIAAPYGSQIVAAQAGVVTWAGWRNNGGGYVITIDHGNGLRTSYNHLGSIWVSPGQYVAAGQGIGGVGCTGLCTGPHVHFEVIVNGVIDNPLRYL